MSLKSCCVAKISFLDKFASSFKVHYAKARFSFLTEFCASHALNLFLTNLRINAIRAKVTKTMSQVN